MSSRESKDADDDSAVHAPSKPGVKITLALIKEACFPGEAAAHDADEVLKERTLRLNDYNIEAIDGLELMSHVHDLYLQNNLITRIENLEMLGSLKFLVLAGNSITKVEGVLNLPRLEYLDLSRNKIEELDDKQLPQTLVGASFADNPCADDDDYRITMMLRLPQLRFLDQVPIPYFERRVTYEVMGLDPPAPVDGVDDLGEEEYAAFFDDSLATDDAVLADLKRIRAQQQEADAAKIAAATGAAPAVDASAASAGAGAGAGAGASAGAAVAGAGAAGVGPDHAGAAGATAAAGGGGLSKDRIRELMGERQTALEVAQSAVADTSAALSAAKARLEAAKKRSYERRAADEQHHEQVAKKIAEEAARKPSD